MNTFVTKKMLVLFFFLPQCLALAENINDVNSDKIMNQLLSKDEKIHQEGKNTLFLIAEKDISGIDKYLKYKDNWIIRYEAVSVLSSIQWKASTNRLLEVIFQDTNPAVKASASRSLKGRENDITKDEILKLLEMDDTDVIRGTLEVIQKITIDEPILNSLSKKLEDKRWYIRTDVAQFLSKAEGIATETKVNLILNAINEICENPLSIEQTKDERMCLPLTEHIKSLYRSALLNIGDSAILPLEKRVGKEKNEFWKNLIVILGNLGDQNVYPDLINIAAKDKNIWLRAEAIGGMGAIGNKDATHLLRDLLNDNFKVATKTDIITPDAYKGTDGFYYYDYYPVQSASFSALLKLGIKVENKGKGVYEVIE